MGNDVAIEELHADGLDELAPLWHSLREHHLAVAAEWFPEPHDAATSWQLRRRQYEHWLSEPDSFALVARSGERAVGYALVHVRGGSPTWRFGERAGEIETLSVLPEERGRGIGRQLLAAVCDRLESVGASEVSLHSLCGNLDAERFYGRTGFRPFAVWMTRRL